MNSEDIARLVERLELSNESKGPTVTISDSEQEYSMESRERLLVGKIFHSRDIKKETIRNQIPKILHMCKILKIEKVGDNIFAIEFASEKDRHLILKENPWHYYGSLMVFKVPTGLQNHASIVFDEFSVWIQLHNLPFLYRETSFIRKFGSQLGIVEEVDNDGIGSAVGQFVRIKVRKRIDKPLEKCFYVADDKSEERCMVLLLYENLSDFCYACGCVGHMLHGCEDESAKGFDRSPTIENAGRNKVFGYLANIQTTIKPQPVTARSDKGEKVISTTTSKTETEKSPIIEELAHLLINGEIVKDNTPSKAMQSQNEKIIDNVSDIMAEENVQDSTKLIGIEDLIISSSTVQPATKRQNENGKRACPMEGVEVNMVSRKKMKQSLTGVKKMLAITELADSKPRRAQ
ncbi:hypothetical protein C2S53_010152 [Perilla frutescens var. hirtella]|uniref:DUF4283 domain-containing protein n=1 Tax=Perilla frutescens var. hirtella TaxID=608512 RepID=A0AAD4NX40_PERFH|nr:hypothetical protein C2S53_010152 [Perilla frutescens var. hirtella]